MQIDSWCDVRPPCRCIDNKLVIVGVSHTVGAAGGYIRGGGHPAFGAWKGMGSDDVLQFPVVNAEVCSNRHYHSGRMASSAHVSSIVDNWSARSSS